jgi:2-oxoglutarate ferredoxin oxidoreductase subunit gamma
MPAKTPDPKRKPALMEETIIIAGQGGQNIQFTGRLLATAAMELGCNATLMAAYGVETRGGFSRVEVTISSQEIGSPVIDKADILILLSKESYSRYHTQVKPTGVRIVNTSLIKVEDPTGTVTDLKIPATQLSIEMQLPRLANLIMLGAFLKHSRLFELDHISKVLFGMVKGTIHENYLENNRQALEFGFGLMGKG